MQVSCNLDVDYSLGGCATIVALLTVERGKPAQIVTEIPELEVGVGYVILSGACSPDIDSTFSVREVPEHQSVELDQAVLIPDFRSQEVDAEFDQMFGFENGKYVVGLVQHKVSNTVSAARVEGDCS